MNEDTTLSLEDLQKAIQRDSFGEIGPEQEELEPGPVEETFEEGDEQEAQPEPEPEPVQEEPEEEPVEQEAEPVEPQHKVLTEDELNNLVVKAKVNGKEVEYTWADLRDIRQTQDAASEWLERAKQEFKAEREAFRKEMESQPKPQADDEYLTEEERRDRVLEQKIQQIEAHQRQFAESQLASEEERYMRTVFEKDGLDEVQAGERLKLIIEHYPSAARFAAELFSTDPKDPQDLDKRKATFDTLWQLNKTIEMPEVVRKVAEEAKSQGKIEAKKEAKRQLTDTTQGQAEMRDTTRTDKLRDLAGKKGRTDDDFAQFLLDESVILKNLR